jgi:hypothetical protein
VIQTSEALIRPVHLTPRRAEPRGHALAQKLHEADRWVATTPAALRLELVAGDGIFEHVAGLAVDRIRR